MICTRRAEEAMPATATGRTPLSLSWDPPSLMSPILGMSGTQRVSSVGTSRAGIEPIVPFPPRQRTRVIGAGVDHRSAGR